MTAVTPASPLVALAALCTVLRGSSEHAAGVQQPASAAAAPEHLHRQVPTGELKLEPGQHLDIHLIKTALAETLGFAGEDGTGDVKQLVASLGGVTKELKQLPPELLAKSFGGTIAAALTTPLDVCKVAVSLFRSI